MVSSVFDYLLAVGVSTSNAQIAHHVDCALLATEEGKQIQESIRQYNDGLVTFAELLNVIKSYFTN